MKLAMAMLAAVAAALISASAAAASPWSVTNAAASSGDGTHTLSTSSQDGSTGPAKFHYDYIDPFTAGSPGSSATGDFDFSTTADATGDVSLEWSYAGFHAFFQVQTQLTAFVDGSGGETLYPLVNAGPTNCCNEPSNGFSYAGRVTLPGVQAGDSYGFRIHAANGDSNATLMGDLAIAWVVDTAVDTTTTGNCDPAVPDDCSLREAITKANASPGFDGINFDIPGPGAHTISPASALPNITGPVEIDGTTQPGFLGPPVIELSGASAGNVHGLTIAANDVGIHGLAINSFQGSGIVIPSGADHATIDGNYIGTDPSGAIDLGNAGLGIFMTDTSNTRIGGAAAGQANVISGNGAGGVQFGGAGPFNLVWGNRIGTDAAGTSALTNAGTGVYVSGTTTVQIGGGGAGEGNVISAATGPVGNADGIQLYSGGNSVYGNKIGTDISGTADLGNGNRGILVTGDGNQIGAASFGAGNIISGNDSTGIEISGSSNVFEGNLVGVDAGGLTALPNGYGVQIAFGDHNRVGGTTFLQRNIISGNLVHGVLLNAGANNNDVQGNYVGLGDDGLTPVPNGVVGVCVCQADSDNVIGGTDPGAGNVISGNGLEGIQISGTGTALPDRQSEDNTVVGNIIGLAANGATAAGNGGDGINIVGGGDGTTIGGTTAGTRNVIASNDAFGVRASQAADLVIQGNYIGVDASGVTESGNLEGIDLTQTVDALVGGTDPGAGNVIGGNEFGIYVNYPDGGVIQGNYVGVGADGSSDVGNTSASSIGIGITVDQTLVGGDPAQIGGTTAAARNVVSNNEEGILLLDAAAGTTIQGNTIGLDASEGWAGNTGNGIEVSGTNGALIGGATTGARNVIARNSLNGIEVDDGSVGTMIQGNYIGTRADGTSETGNFGAGVLIQGGSTSTVVGGAATAAGDPPGNLIRSNDQGVLIQGTGTDGNYVRGNLIGLEPDGVERGPNFGAGVEIRGGAQNNVVGNDTGSGADYNVISFSGDESEPGVLIDGVGTDENHVVGNRIGTTADGTDTAPNDTGVVISGGADGNFVGEPGIGNLISGNNNTPGVLLTGAATSGNGVFGNRIGMTLDGLAALPNDDGVLIEAGAHDNDVGGPGAGEGNIIAGNDHAGVRIDGFAGDTYGNVVKGNTIGVEVDEDTVLANDIGVQLTDGAHDNWVGLESDDDAASGNTIAWNEDANVLVNNDSDNNTITGNTIINAAEEGIRVLGGSDETMISENEIAFNGTSLTGIQIGPGVRNTIRQNSIHDNIGLGIDLAGISVNDYLADCSGSEPDCDSGPNDGQNFPDLASAQISGGDLNVDGTIDSDPENSDDSEAQYRIEVFASPDCNGSGFGEGESFLGSIVADVDVDGHAAWSFQDEGTSVTPGQVVTATATDDDGNTSEFSQCVTVTAPVSPLSATIDLSQDDPDVRAGAQSVPIGGIDLATLTRGAGPNTASSPLDGIPLEGIAIAGSPLEGIPLEGIGLTPQNLNQALGGVHLSDIPLTPPASWTQLLAGTRLANVPLATLTLADVLALPSPPTSSITLGTISLHGTPLEGIGLGGIALGPKLLSAVPLEGIGTTPAENLQDWCDAINAQAGYSCSNPATTLANETVMGQVLRGVPLEGIPLDGIPLEGIDLTGTPLEGIPLEGIDLTGTPLEGIPLEGINMAVSPLEGIPLEGINIIGSPLEGIPLEGIPTAGLNLAIDCGAGFCLPTAGNTLGDAVTANRIKPGATLGMLDGGYGTVTLDNLVDALEAGSGLSLADLVPGLPTGHTLHDLLAAMLGASSYDWSTLNLNTFPIADFSSDGGVAHYTVEFEVSGGALLIQPVTIHATLPAGGRYVPHSAEYGIADVSSNSLEPTVGAGGQLSWSLNALRGQEYFLSWEAKPGLDLGTSAVGANIQLSNGTTLATPVSTRVIQTFNDTNLPDGDTNDDPATAPQLAGNSLYVSHLTKGDTDYYRIPIGAYGSRVEVTLSHIPDGSDYDLALAGPPAPRLRTAPVNAIPLGNQQLQDTSVDLNHRDQPLPPEALQDVPTGELASSGRVVRAVADNRGSAPEHLTLLSQGEAGSYTIQITDYQGDSPDPYLLEVKSIPPPGFGPCAPRSITNSTAAAPPSVSAGTQTLFLVNERRLIATFGTSATSTLMTKLSTLAGRSDVAGSIVRVETGPGVPAAYNAWDATPCSPEQANNVVRTIGSYLDTLLTSGPNVKYVVVVGGDDMVPFARVPDNTEIANERTYRESLGQSANQFLGSIGAGFLLTDDVWGEKAAPDFLGNELFVPELAVGRLVESPTDMGKTIDGYIAANGLLAPTSSLVTGYDFLTDGATSINVPFAAGLGTNAKTLINDTWDRNQLLAQLFPAGGGGPKLSSLNAHFDHQRLLPAAENAANRQSNLVTTADITAAMAGRLGFSIGCHSGLVVSDAVFGAGNLLGSDWAQAMLGQGAAGWIGNTGYGLGDTTDVAYSERLHALFSRKLDGTLTVGQALEQAKQDYLGTLAVMSPYDAKVMMEATLYGLPMLKLGSGIPPTPPPPPPLHTDPATGLQAASFDVSPTFTPVVTANGRYYKADSGIQSTPRRPLEPLVSLDVTQPGTLVAHGALINLLNSPAADEPNFDAIFSQVTTDQAADDPTLAGVNAFPSKIQSVATFSGLTTRKQRLNLIVGLFRSDGPTLAGIGTQRRYTRVAGDTLYSTSTDWLEPELGELQTLRIGTTGVVGFATSVTDPTAAGAGALVKTVKVLYRDCNGTWRTATLLPATGDRWAGSGIVTPAGCLNIDYYLEAADGAGNVAVSSKKVQLEPLVAPPDEVPDGASPITHTLSPASPTASGWYAGAVQVTLSSVDSIRYSVDGVALEDYTAPFVVTGDGPHFVEASTEEGATHTFGFAVDASGPVVTITRTPGTPDVNGWYTFNVNEQVSAQDPGGSNVQQIRCVLDPPGAPPTLFSQLPASCPYVAGGNINADGVHKLYAAATDSAGNAGAVVSDTFGIDKTAPVTTMGALAPFQTAASYSPTWSGFDAGSGVKNFDIRYRQAASNSSTFGGYTAWQSATPALTAAFTGTAGVTTCFSGRARDNAGWLPFAYSAESCSTVPLNDTSLTRSGFWSTTSAADLYGGSASRSTSTGSTLTSPTMVGSQIGVLVTKQPGGGTIQLRWNGSTKVTQSLSAPSRQPKQLLSFSLASVQSGTLQVYVSGSGTVDIDGAGAFKRP